jgi:hypothetical protein
LQSEDINLILNFFEREMNQAVRLYISYFSNHSLLTYIF